MAFDYTASIELGKRLIDRFGFKATLRRHISTGPAHDPTYDVETHQITTVDAGNMVVGANETDNVAIRERTFFIAGDSGVVPRKGDVIVVGQLEYVIHRVDTTSPGNVDVVYQLAVNT